MRKDLIDFIKKIYAKIIWLLRYVIESIFILKIKHAFKYVITRPTKKYDVVIIDDFLPNILSTFRAFEFAYLLNKIENSALFSILQTKLNNKRNYHNYFISSEEQFEGYKKEFVKNFKVSSNKINPFYTWTKIRTKLVYVVFLENAYTIIDFLEKNKIRFILELYPGGGFYLLTEGESYKKLQKVLNSPCFTHVIVTQTATQRFLIENQLCTPDKITFKYGGVGPSTFYGLPEKKIKYNINKPTLDICFTAAKYMPKGLDKGYDIFIAAAHLLLQQSDKYHFHIVGGFDENDIPIDPPFLKHFHFYNYLKTNQFIEYYKNKDIIVAPNRPGTLMKGAFDGFPTGACSEAGQNGLCMIFSDPLNLNVVFENNKNGIFTENDPNKIADIITWLSNNPEEIYRIGENGKKLIMSEDPSVQLDLRLSLINKFIDKEYKE